MMDIRRAAALLLALVMIAALTVGCGKKQSDTPTDTPAAGADVRTPDQQPAKLVCYNGSVTLRFVREEDTWYWGDDQDFPLEQSIVTELLATVQGYAALSPLPHTDDLSQFGLSDTKRYISLTDTEGNTRTYWLGTQTDEGQYIQPEGETDAVYLSPAGVDGTLSMGIYDMARLPQLPQLTADFTSDVNEDVQDLAKQLAQAQAELAFYQEQLTAAREAGWANLSDKADDILAKLANGADFDVMIAEYNDDSGMASGSTARKNGGYAVCEGYTSFDSDFLAAAMALEKVGDVSGQVRTQFGTHILLYADDVTEGPIDLETVRDSLTSSLLTTKQNDTYDAQVEDWKNADGMKITTHRDLLDD